MGGVPLGPTLTNPSNRKVSRGGKSNIVAIALWENEGSDKPYQVPTSHTDKQTGLEKYTESPPPDLQSVLPLQFLMNFWEKKRIKCRPINKSESRSRLNIWIPSCDQNVQISFLYYFNCSFRFFL